MGIKGIYNEIGPGRRIALSKLAIEHLEQNGRPLRLAIDISIWLFQIQSAKGGTNPALRTFYYRLLRLISLSIHPLFVFDGPNKPPFKRGKRTGPNVASIPEFLAKQLLKQFALPFHIAPGEAEAECALLQREGIVDAVLSEDVDTLMFGSGLTMRNWSPEGTLKTRTFTHINLYDAQNTKESSGLDREGMILVALMSGGDYIPEGIPGCGPKTACDAAKAGFGKDLCAISRNETAAITTWKERLIHELRTNESKYFRSKHKALVIPDDFPRQDVLRYYTHPCVSPTSKIDSLRETLKWDQPIDISGLRTFAGEAFDWTCLGGAKKFIRNLAPALLARELRMHANEAALTTDDAYDIATREAHLIKTIHLKRQHISTDNMTELRVGFVPINLVRLDLGCEDPDPELPLDEDSESEEACAGVDIDEQVDFMKRRGPLIYDPTTLEKIWIPETLAKLGVPMKFQDWEESFRDARRFIAMRSLTKRAEKAHKSRGGMPAGAIDRFTKVTKPGMTIHQSMQKDPSPIIDKELAGSRREPLSAGVQADCPDVVNTGPNQTPEASTRAVFKPPPSVPLTPPKSKSPLIVEIISSPVDYTAAATCAANATVVPKRKRELRRSQSDTSGLTKQPSHSIPPCTNVEILPRISLTDLEQQTLEPILELPSSVTIRRHRSPLRRTQSISSTTTTQFHQTTLSNLKRDPSQKSRSRAAPPPLPPTTDKNGCRIATKDLTIRAASAQPSTPKKLKQPTYITISSSPATTPQSAQRFITDYISPSRRRRSISPTRPTPQAQSVPPSQPAQQARYNGDDATVSSLSTISTNPLPDITVSKPVFRLPLGTSHSTVLNTSRASSSSSSLTNDSSMPSKEPSNNPVAQLQVEPQPHARHQALRTGEIIRVRESLEGAWALESVEPLENEETKSAEREAGRKRKRTAKGAARQWRLSQVGMVDLT